jgi:hypothetical protein
MIDETGKARLIRKAETPEDISSHDLIPDHLKKFDL